MLQTPRRPLAALSSLLVSYDVADHPELAFGSTRSGQAITLVRATTGPISDAYGTALSVAAQQPRLSMYDVDADSVRETLGWFIGRAGGGVNADRVTLDTDWPMQVSETWYIRIVRPAYADSVGDIGWVPYMLSRGLSGGPHLALRFKQLTRDVEAALHDGTTATSVSASIPAGQDLAFCAQFDLLTSAPRCRLDVGSGFGSWSAGALAAIASLSGDLAIGDAAWSAGNTLDGALRTLRLDDSLLTHAVIAGTR